MVETSISDLLCERASLQPNDTAFTFIDYEQDWDGVGESVTWSHLRRARSHLGGLQLARCRRRGSGCGDARFDPITTSGKVRRATCVEQYRQGQFARLNA